MTPKPVATSDLKRLNTLNILRFLRRSGPAARSEIAAATDLARGTITGLLAPLLETGLVHEVPERLETGRPSPKLDIGAGQRGILVVELTIDHFHMWVGDLAETEVFHESVRHHAHNSTPEAVFEPGRQLMLRAVQAAECAGLALVGAMFVVPAPINQEKGEIAVSTDFGWRNAPARKLLTQDVPLKVPLVLIPDVIVGAWAEYSDHSRKHGEPTTFAYLKSGTGIGGGLIHEGRFYTGSHMQPMVAPHVPLDPSGPQCICGQRGCLLTLAGPDVTLERAGLAQMQATAGTTAALVELIRLAKQGDPQVQDSVEQTVKWLVQFLLILQRTSDPAVVVLGGYWRYLAPTVRSGFEQTMARTPLPNKSMLQHARILPAQLGDAANRTGAADRAIIQYFETGQFNLD